MWYYLFSQIRDKTSLHLLVPEQLLAATQIVRQAKRQDCDQATLSLAHHKKQEAKKQAKREHEEDAANQERQHSMHTVMSNVILFLNISQFIEMHPILF